MPAKTELLNPNHFELSKRKDIICMSLCGFFFLSSFLRLNFFHTVVNSRINRMACLYIIESILPSTFLTYLKGDKT